MKDIVIKDSMIKKWRWFIILIVTLFFIVSTVLSKFLF